MKEAPEVVARIREVSVRRGRDTTGIDAAEEHPQSGREHIGDFRLRLLRARRARSGHGRPGTPRSARAAPRLRPQVPGGPGAAPAPPIEPRLPPPPHTLRYT